MNLGFRLLQRHPFTTTELEIILTQILATFGQLMVNQTGQCYLQLKVKTQSCFVLIWEDVKISSGKKPLKAAVVALGMAMA